MQPDRPLKGHPAMKEIPATLTATFDLLVGSEHTADAMGNTGMGVLATPYVVLMVEAAAARAVQPYLDAGEGVAGTHIDLHHLAPTAVGRRAQATVHLTARDGRRLQFSARVESGGGIIAEGTYASMIVTLARVLARAEAQPADTA